MSFFRWFACDGSDLHVLKAAGREGHVNRLYDRAHGVGRYDILRKHDAMPSAGCIIKVVARLLRARNLNETAIVTFKAQYFWSMASRSDVPFTRHRHDVEAEPFLSGQLGGGQ